MKETKQDSEEISIIDLWNVLYNSKNFIIGFVALSSAIAIIYSLSATELYKAETVVYPSEEIHSGGLAGMMGGSSLQLLMPQISNSLNETAKYFAILRSNLFLSKFIEEKKLKSILFYDEWNKSEKVWLEGEPSSSKAYRKLKSIIEVDEEPATGIIRISVTWHDKEIASLWTNELVSRLNDHIRLSDIKETKQSLEFMKEEINKTSLKIPQNVLYNIMGELTSKMMMANTKEEYAFKVIDYAQPPEFRFFPQRTNIVLVTAFLSFLLACILSITLNILRNLKG